MNTFESNFRYMFNYIESNIANINSQFIGRKIDGEKLILAKDKLSISTESINEKLMSYFFDSFLEESFFKFKAVASDLNLNPVYKLVKMIFDQERAKILKKALSKNLRRTPTLNKTYKLLY